MKMRLFLQISAGTALLLIILLTISTLASYSTPEQISPSDTLSKEQIKVTENTIQIDIPNAILVTYSNTNSMDPLLDSGANGIEIPVTESTELNIGDIVSYEAYWNETLVSHRIIDIEQDEQGTYYILKGDNNSSEDPGKVRHEQIKYKLIGVLY
ncbi:hypothetical protein CL616_04110 [archaeon]|nr:hypothetical protein [archaeon]